MKAPAAAALALLLPLGALAARPMTPPAPEFPAGAAWINAKPFSLKMLRKRRVVLVAFLNPDSLHSLRALEALKYWQQRYEQYGLLIVGVMTPELPFQNDAMRTKEHFKRFGVDFPIVIDEKGELWKAYANEGWPSFYLIDAKGRIVLDRLGEGGYAEIEGEIRIELAAAGFTPAPAAKKIADRLLDNCGSATPEVSVGLRRGSALNLGKTKRPRADNYLTAGRQGEVGYLGSWEAEPEALRLARDNKSQSSYIQVLYRGAQAFSLLDPPREGSRYYVRQDRLWLHLGNAGSDIRFDDDGRSFVDARQTRQHHLTQNPSDAMHVLELIAVRQSAGVYGFAFTDRCFTLRLPP